MRHVRNEKREITQDRRNRTTESRENQNALRKGNLRILGRYSGPFLKWTREDLKQMHLRTRKLMTIHKALHPRDDVDRLKCVKKRSRKGTHQH